MAYPLSTLRLTLSLRHRLALAGFLGLGLGSACTIIDHDGDCAEACNESLFECLEDADGPGDLEACDASFDSCMEQGDDGDWRGDHDDDEPGEGDDDGRSPTDDAGDDGDGDDAGDGDGDDAGEPRDPGDGGDPVDGPQAACFELHATCVGLATTVADVEACQTLFEQCIEAEQCDDACGDPVCPDPEVTACLDIYGACAAQAQDTGALDACAAGFDACVGDVDDSACVPHDPATVDACLEQHALCTECIDGPQDLWLCQDVFDTCLAG